jgi:uncharacterized protein YjiS (DUF1127 family)
MMLKKFVDAWAGIGRRRAQRYLAELDERTLKDIGLEAWRTPLGAEIARRRERLRRLDPLASLPWR